MRRAPVALVASLALGAATITGCGSDSLDEGGSSGEGSSSSGSGEVEVSVKHRLAFIERIPRKVRDELETLARNEAPGLQGNTIHAMGEPLRGAQRFAVWRCGG